MDRDALSLVFKIKYFFSSPFFAFLFHLVFRRILVSHFIHMPASIELPSRSHDKPIGVSPSCHQETLLQASLKSTILLFSLSRSENHCRRCDRIREEPARCDNPDDVLPLRLCAHGPSDLHGGPHAKVYKKLS